MPLSVQRKQCPNSVVVDDLPDAAQTFAAMLQSLGCEATAITDPYAAVDTVERIGADAVFLDLNMPGLTGLDLARILRRKYGWQRLRIVAVTGFGSQEHRTATREAGFDAHVVKPVDIRDLERTLHTLFPEMRWTSRPV